ncbi:nitroreductase family protein [Candidatus Woesearchaeota archaeon]|nr:nitroreductase family protein [Candidatus Woesearchaeota archaeon]
MKIIDIIKKRRSIREFLDKQVEFHKIVDVIEAGMHAPSAGNLQNWKFIIIRDQEKREQIAEACVEQYWISLAPVMIIICSENERAERYYEERGVNFYNIQNCAAAAQNMLLMATELGLSSCWIGAFNEDRIKSLLLIPENVKINIILPIGYSNTKPEEKHMLDIKELFYYEEWGIKIKNIHKIMGIETATFKDIILKGKELINLTSQKISETLHPK